MIRKNFEPSLRFLNKLILEKIYETIDQNFLVFKRF